MKHSHINLLLVCKVLALFMLFWVVPISAATWWDGFGGQLLTGRVHSVASYDNTLFVGGDFTTSSLFTSNLVYWNGTNFVQKQLPGAGGGWPEGVVNALAVHQGELYVAANVHASSGAPSNYIIRWDGSVWSAVGSQPNLGPDNRVFTLLSSGSDLYAGGDFISSDGILVNHVARWDGTTWHALGDGLNGQVVALTEYSGQIVAAGSFNASGGTPTSGVAIWNGTSWQPAGDPIFGVTALAVYDGKLIVAGQFSLTSGDNVAWLDGATWRALGGGTDGAVQALTVAGGKLYVGGGYFSSAGKGSGKVDAFCIAAWDGAHWSALGAGVWGASDIRTLFTNDNDVIMGGYFTTVDGISAVSIAVWNGQFWDNTFSNYGRGLDGGVGAMLSDGRSVVVGGQFTYAGGIQANCIARWDGGWHTYGPGFNGAVNALVKYNGDLIAAGMFWYSGGVEVGRIARWNGTSWESVGGGIAGGIDALAIYNGDLIAAGNFQEGQLWPYGIYRWDGTSWQRLGTAFNDGATFSSMVVYGGELYVGGNFNRVGEAIVRSLAKWDGASWSEVGGGLWGSTHFPTVSSLIVFQGMLFVTGDFAFVSGPSGVPVGNVARWNGTSWLAAGTLPAGTRPLTNYFGTLLAGIRSWNGVSNWNTYINTTPAVGGIGQMLAHDGSLVKGLFMGGGFLMLGGVPTFKVALYNPVWNSTGVGDKTPVSSLEAVPNPFQRALSIRFSLETPKPVEVSVFDLAGRRVTALVKEGLPAGQHEFFWDARDSQGKRLSAGVYFIRVREGESVVSRRVVLMN